MNLSSQALLFLIILCLVTQGFFAMVEMACVSFNKVRLQYYVSKGIKRAIWLNDLLQHPGRLFGSALICINASLLIGSEASRRLYESLNLDPDFAPLTQVIIVIIFAEIAPLFAGRRYAEHAAMIGVPVLYAISFILKPLIDFFDLFCQMVHSLIGSSEKGGLSLSREELQKILEEKDEEDFNTTSVKIFALRTMTAKELMKPLQEIVMISSTATLLELRVLLEKNYSPFVPLFQKSPSNIMAIIYPRDLLRLTDQKKVRDYAKAPWFITTKDPILSILKQFRHNNQSVAVVLDEKGGAAGILTLDEIIDEIFGLDDNWMSFEEIVPRARHVVVDRSFPSHQSIEEFNQTYHVHLDGHGKKTLEELMIHTLGHIPTLGETVRIDQFELIVEEVTLLGIKTIGVSTLY
ncbi:CNNM domain-containing protein [Rhabdochlamydiaceae symbiont of Dictyostelium giganteum]|uniref:CNNM domain-containing protein n=1 Tax=Rhabdochlamydiaceae symbiont of Dictyostelium giganteum TaxID=3342349 RepID=UPI00384DFED0